MKARILKRFAAWRRHKPGRGWWPVAAVVCGIAILGTALRFYGLGDESLWRDEGFSVTRAGLDALRMISEAPSDPTPPLYYLLLHYWISFFGESNFSVRVISAVAGSLSVLVMYRLGSLLFSRFTGVAAAMILAVSELHVYYSQEARTYSLFCLLVLLSFYFFVRLLRTGAGGFAPAGYVLSTVLAMYAHLYGLFVLAAQVAYLLTAFGIRGRFGVKFVPETRPRVWTPLYGALAVLYIPGLVFLAAQLSDPQGRTWMAEPGLSLLARLPVFYSGSLPMFLAFAALAAVAVLKSWGPDGAPQGVGRVYLLGLWLLGSTALPFAVSLVSVNALGHWRHTIAASLAFYLLAARGLEHLAGRAYRGRVMLAASVLLVAASAPGLYTNYTELHKHDWQGAVNYIEDNYRPGDLVLHESDIVIEQYFRREDVVGKNLSEMPKGRLEGYDRVWLVLSEVREYPSSLPGESAYYFRLAERRLYRGTEVNLFERSTARKP